MGVMLFLPEEVMGMPDSEILRDYMMKEVVIIQDIIKRMATNSFFIKGWAATLVVGTLLLKGNWYQVWIAYIPILVFWYLDAYYLWQERLYRKLYNWVITNRLNTDEYLFDMNAYRFKDEVQSKLRIMVSETIGLFYGAIAVLVTLYLVLLWASGGG